MRRRVCTLLVACVCGSVESCVIKFLVGRSVRDVSEMPLGNKESGACLSLGVAGFRGLGIQKFRDSCVSFFFSKKKKWLLCLKLLSVRQVKICRTRS